MGTLAARDLSGAELVVKEWPFEIRRKDMAVPAYGPNGRGCANGGEAVDATPFDHAFTCSYVLCRGIQG